MGRHRRPSSSAGSAAQGRARPGDTGATEQYPADGPPPGATRPAAPGTTPVPPPLAQMAFLRCNSDHHCVAFNQAAW
ncbi:hypothetical protein AB0L20_30885, partial [Streptomyces albidoflavus]